MEISHTGLTRENKKLIKRIEQFISYHQKAKLDGEPPDKISITSKQYQKLEENMLRMKRKPPYTINQVLIVPVNQ